jgi:hypothetical protein
VFLFIAIPDWLPLCFVAENAENPRTPRNCATAGCECSVFVKKEFAVLGVLGVSVFSATKTIDKFFHAKQSKNSFTRDENDAALAPSL